MIIKILNLKAKDQRPKNLKTKSNLYLLIIE